MSEEICPHCLETVLDERGFCETCSAYRDDEKCDLCDFFLDYDGICPNHCHDDDA